MCAWSRACVTCVRASCLHDVMMHFVMPKNWFRISKFSRDLKRQCQYSILHFIIKFKIYVNPKVNLFTLHWLRISKWHVMKLSITSLYISIYLPRNHGAFPNNCKRFAWQDWFNLRDLSYPIRYKYRILVLPCHQKNRMRKWFSVLTKNPYLKIWR